MQERMKHFAGSNLRTKKQKKNHVKLSNNTKETNKKKNDLRVNVFIEKKKGSDNKKIIKHELTDLDFDVPIRFLMSRKQGLSCCKFQDMFKQGVSHTELARTVDRRKNWTNKICKRSI